MTVTLPDEIFADASELAKEAGLPVSAWLAQRIAHQVRIERGLAAMREWDDEHGPIAAAAVAQAEALFAEATAGRIAGGEARKDSAP